MAAKRKRAPGAEIEPSRSSPLGAFDTDVPIGPAREIMIDPLVALDVRAQSALLQEAFQTQDPTAVETPVTTPQRGGMVSRYGWRAVKSALGLLIVIIAGVGPLQRLLELSSTEAVVNARLVSLRAPIDGRIEDFAPTIGTAVSRGRLVLHITNRRADRGRLDDLQRMVDQIEGERPAIARRLARLKEIHEQIARQARAFQAGRIQELEERVLDLKAQVSATEVSEAEAASTLARTRVLAVSGYQA